MQKEDGAYTEDMQDTLDYLNNRFIQTDDPHTDTPMHTDIREYTNLIPEKPTDDDLTTMEIDDVIMNLNKKKAPGPDDFNVEIIQQVAYLGTSNLFGRVVTTFLRQFPNIQRLNIYGYNEPISLSEDFRGSCELHQYLGKEELPTALENVDIVVIGDETDSNEPSRECVLNIASKVFDYAFVTASVAPNAMVVVSTKPLNLIVPLMGHVLQDLGCFDGRKLLGVTSEEGLRANPLYAELIGVEEALLPVVGGSSPQTRVPLLSQAKPNANLKEEEKHKLINDIKSFDFLFPKEEIEAERAYATIRLLRSLIQGLENKDGPVSEMAMTRTTLVADTSYFSLPVHLGRVGVERAFGLPPLEGLEEELLEYAVINLNHDLTRAFDIFRGLKPSIEGITAQSISHRKENLTMVTHTDDQLIEKNDNIKNATIQKSIDEEGGNHLNQTTKPTLEKHEQKNYTLNHQVYMPTPNNDKVIKPTINYSTKNEIHDIKEPTESITAANTDSNHNVGNEIYGLISDEVNKKDSNKLPKAIMQDKIKEETTNQLKKEITLLDIKKEPIAMNHNNINLINTPTPFVNKLTVNQSTKDKNYIAEAFDIHDDKELFHEETEESNNLKISQNKDFIRSNSTNETSPNKLSSESFTNEGQANPHHLSDASECFINNKKQCNKNIFVKDLENEDISSNNYNTGTVAVSTSVNHSLNSKKLDDLTNEIEKYIINENESLLNGSSEFENNNEKIEEESTINCCPAPSAGESLINKKIGKTCGAINENILNEKSAERQGNAQSQSNSSQTPNSCSAKEENKTLNKQSSNKVIGNNIETRTQNIVCHGSKAENKYLIKKNENNNHDEQIKDMLNSPGETINTVICKEFSLRGDEGYNWQVPQETSHFTEPQDELIDYHNEISVTKNTNSKFNDGEESNINSMIKNVCCDVNKVITTQVGNVQKMMGLIKNKLEFTGTRIEIVNNHENINDIKRSKMKEKVSLKRIKNQVENVFEPKKVYQSSTDILDRGSIKKTNNQSQGQSENNITLKGKNLPSVMKTCTKIVNMMQNKNNKIPKKINWKQTKNNIKLTSHPNSKHIKYTSNEMKDKKKVSNYLSNLKCNNDKSLNKEQIYDKEKVSIHSKEQILVTNLVKGEKENNLPVTMKEYNKNEISKSVSDLEVKQNEKVIPIETNINLMSNICKNSVSENKDKKANFNHSNKDKNFTEKEKHKNKNSDTTRKITSCKINSQTSIQPKELIMTEKNNITGDVKEIKNEVTLRSNSLESIENVSNKLFPNLIEHMLPIKNKLSDFSTSGSEIKKINSSLDVKEDVKVKIKGTNIKLSSSNISKYVKSVIKNEIIQEKSDNDGGIIQTNEEVFKNQNSPVAIHNIQRKSTSSGQALGTNNSSVKVEKNISDQINSQTSKLVNSTKINNVTYSHEDKKEITNEATLKSKINNPSAKNENLSEHQLSPTKNKLSKASTSSEMKFELNKAETNKTYLEVKHESNNEKVNHAITNIKPLPSLLETSKSNEFNIPRTANKNVEEMSMNRNSDGKHSIANKPEKRNVQITKVNETSEISKISLPLQSQNKTELKDQGQLNNDILYLKQFRLNTSKIKCIIRDKENIEENKIYDKKLKFRNSISNFKIGENKYEHCEPSSVTKSISSGTIETDEKLNTNMPLNLINQESEKTKYSQLNESKYESGLEKVNLKEVVEEKNINLTPNTKGNSFTRIHIVEKKKTDNFGNSMSMALNFETNAKLKSDKFVKRYTLLKKGEVSTMMKEDLNVDKCKATLFKHNQKTCINKGSSSKENQKHNIHQESNLLENINDDPGNKKTKSAFKPEESFFIFDRCQKKKPSTSKPLEKIIGIRGSHNLSLNSKNKVEHLAEKIKQNNKVQHGNKFEKEARKKLSMSKLLNDRKNKSNTIQHFNHNSTKKKVKNNKKDASKSKINVPKLISRERKTVRHVSQNVGVAIENNKHLTTIIPKETNTLITKTIENVNINESKENVILKSQLETKNNEIDKSKLVTKETNNPIELNKIKLATKETMGDKNEEQITLSQTTSKTINAENKIKENVPDVASTKVTKSVKEDNSHISKKKSQGPKPEIHCASENVANFSQVNSIKVKTTKAKENQNHQTNIKYLGNSKIENKSHSALIKSEKSNTTIKENNPVNTKYHIKTKHANILNKNLENKSTIVKNKVIPQYAQASLNSTEEKITVNKDNQLYSDKIPKQIENFSRFSMDVTKSKTKSAEKELIITNKNIILKKKNINSIQAEKLPRQTLPNSNHLQWSTKSLKASQGIGLFGSKGENIKEITQIRIDRNPFTAGKIKMNTHLFKEYMNSNRGIQKTNSKGSLMNVTKKGNYLTQNFLQEIINKKEVSKNQMKQNENKIMITDKNKYFKMEKEFTDNNVEVDNYQIEKKNTGSLQLSNRNSIHLEKNKNDMISKIVPSLKYTKVHNFKLQNLLRHEVKKKVSYESALGPYSHLKIDNDKKKLKPLHNFSARNFLELNQVRIRKPYEKEKEPIKKIHLLKAFRSDDKRKNVIQTTKEKENKTKEENIKYISGKGLLKQKTKITCSKDDKSFKKIDKLKGFKEVLPPLGSELPKNPKPMSVQKLKNINTSLTKDARMKHFRSHLKRLFTMFQKVISNETK